jgi:nucleoside-diphosphate-sugar epimerase
LDPAVIGTTGILKSIKQHAPTVKRVIITSSFAAMNNSDKAPWPDHTYTEADWNPVTHEQALSDPRFGYSGSKTFAEQAAWDFVEKENPNFTVTAMNPPMIYGPVIHQPESLDTVNTSNARIRDAMLGKWIGEIPATGLFIWIDVRDIALLHVLALESESEEIIGQRVFSTQGYYSNKEIVEIVRKHYPEYEDRLPNKDIKGGDFPEGGLDGYFKVDNSRSKKLLGKDFISFEQSIVDLVKTLKALGA